MSQLYIIQMDAEQVQLIRDSIGRRIERMGLDRKVVRAKFDSEDKWYKLVQLEDMLSLHGPNPLQPAPTVNGFTL